MFSVSRPFLSRVRMAPAATMFAARGVSYQKRRGSQDVPQYLQADMMKLFKGRTRAKEIGDHDRADFLFRELRREFGVRDIVVDKNRNCEEYSIFRERYAPEDYVEFTRDKDDSLAFPSWLGLSVVERNLIGYMTSVIRQRNEQYRRKRKQCYGTEYKPEDYLEKLSNEYGVQVDIQNKTWRLKEGFAQRRPLHYQVLREELAESIEKWLLENGFTRLAEEDDWAELDCRIYARPLELDEVDPNVGSVTLRVRSSIRFRTVEVTESGEHAIHVYAQYTRNDDSWRHERVLFKAKRVLRVGTLDAIVKRMADRVQKVGEHMVENVQMCPTCEIAPLMTSKKKNRVCSHFCWTESDASIREFILEEELTW